MLFDHIEEAVFNILAKPHGVVGVCLRLPVLLDAIQVDGTRNSVAKEKIHNIIMFRVIKIRHVKFLSALAISTVSSFLLTSTLPRPKLSSGLPPYLNLPLLILSGS